MPGEAFGSFAVAQSFGGWGLLAAVEPVEAPAVDGVAALPGGPMLLVGEIHGTDRGPAAFGALAGIVGREHGALTVGLEISHVEQARIDAFLSSPGLPADRQRLLAADFWTDEHQDGRRSQAMADLLESLRGLVASGVEVEAMAFDPLPDVEPGLREEHLARNLVVARRQHPDVPFLVLVGNLHARTQKGTPWDAEFVPMGARIAAAGIDVLPIDIRHAGGYAWICTGSSAADCGATKLSGKDSPRAAPKLELLDQPEPETGYAGVLWVGEIEASPPAVANSVGR